jgi:hypothetical protein
MGLSAKPKAAGIAKKGKHEMTLYELIDLFTWSDAGFYVTILILAWLVLAFIQRGLRRG